MMGLLSSRLDLDNQKYILVLHALELLANETNDHLQTVAGFLLSNDFDVDCPTYRKKDTGAMVFADDGYGGTFQKTWEILKYFHTTNPHHFYESGYRENYWLKADFFNFLVKQQITHIPSVINWVNSQAKPPSEPQAGEIKPHDDPMELGENQKLMRYFETFTPHDLACFIVDYNPAYNQNDDDFNKAYLLVSKAVNAGVLKPNTQNEIPKEQVKQYLKSLDWIYKGFNDNLPPATDDKIGHATLTQTMPTNSQLSQQVADLKAQLASATDTIASLQEKLQQSNFDRLESYNFNTAELHRAKTELNQYQKENESLKAKIAELGANEPSQSDTPSNEPLLNDRSERSHLITIGILLELLTTPKTPNDKPTYGNQTAVLNTILEYGIYGQGESTLEARLGNANRALQQAKKSK